VFFAQEKGKTAEMRFFFACEIGERGDCFRFPPLGYLEAFSWNGALHLSLIFC
jgi:hypothetical protein